MLNEKKLHKVALFIFSVVMAVMLMLLVAISFTDEIECIQKREDMPITNVEDVTKREILKSDTPAGIIEEYSFSLDKNFKNETKLAFYTVHQYVKVYFDEELVYSLQPKGEHRITKTLGSNWVMIPLYTEDLSKKIRVEITPVYASFKNREITFYLGSSLAIFKDRLKKDLPQILLGGIALLTGLVFLCISICNIIKKRPEKKLIALGLFAIMLGIWKLNDTRFTPFMDFGEPVLIYYSVITMLMFALVPLIEWSRDFFAERERIILNLYELAMGLVLIALIILQWLQIYDLGETLIVIHTNIGIGAVLLIFITARNQQQGKEKIDETIPLQMQLTFVCVLGVIADVITFYIKGNSSGLLFSLAALIIYVLIMGIRSATEYSLQQAKIAKLDRDLAEKEHRLTDSRIKMMMSQIRSHFIFNVLATISTYCKIDPKTADQALICFSRYLRRNIRVIEDDKLIGFSSELEQLEDYVALEQLRFAGQIKFEKTINITSFLIPPLTVQPIVENAIKHGFLDKGISGTVSLYTRVEDKNIRITIKDDGAGFDTEILQNSESVGLKNVSYRLKTMINGTLDIKSKPGKGTTVTILIPKEEREES